MARSTVVRQMTGMTNISVDLYEDLLDDRQGMNDSVQQFTKAEKYQNRPSLDGSVISEIRLDGGKKLLGDKGGGNGGSSSGKRSSRKDKQRRSKSPSSSSLSNNNSNFRRSRHSKKGFLSFASRLKLTRNYEPIAKLQLSILNSGFVSFNPMDKNLQTFLPKERMSPKDFQERVKLMRKYDVLSAIEYKFASRYETYVCRHAIQESNQMKNNYKKCIPYDYNRVVLKTLPNVPHSDYINASHVDSYLKPNAYIAAQGPNENTIEDFWRMIWEQKTFVVVMLTKVFDFIRVMCNQYWPVELNKPERYGNLEVTLLYEEPLADFVIRTIKLTKIRNTHRQQDQHNNTTGGNDTSKQNLLSKPPEGNNQDGYEYEVGGEEEEDDDDYDEEDDYSDNTGSGSEQLTLGSHNHDQLLNHDQDQQQQQRSSSGPAGHQSQSPAGSRLPSVRCPKFVSNRRQRRQLVRSSRFDSEPNALADEAASIQRTAMLAPPHSISRSASQPPENFSRRQSRQTSNRLGLRLERPETPAAAGGSNNDYLHPMSSLSHKLSHASSGSIPSTPNTPLSPRTPSSAGLDRSSATRKAVKKKRRSRTKNSRPMPTQFQVPDESQLNDDDDDDDEEDDYNKNNRCESGLLQENGENGAGAGAATSRGNSERIIYQFHYNSWASHTCPFISSLLHFRRRVRICMDEMSKSGKTGPTIVHCNDGCGRTGTYLCIDANLELAEEDFCYDVYNYTKKMRQSRKFLIENLEQYKFVYEAIEEAMFCGKTWFHVSELHKRLKHKSQRNPLTKKNEYLREYEKITRMTSKFSIGDCAGGHRVENREKNRDVSTVPPDNFRPYLTSFQSNDNTDYINAVFVDGYTRSKEYIVTEWPLHKTISDFWSLIYDHDCNSVILLANPSESSTYPSFLPSEKELRRKFGPVFSAEMVSYTHYQNIKSWIYTINKKIVSLTEVIAGVKSEAKTTQVFQITCWPQGHRVPTSTNALVELMNMVERWRQRTAYGPVCVVSLNGKSRAGVYCAANVAIEQVVQHSEVDVFQAVKTVRRHRPQLIENMTEYKYCYDLILHYVLHYVQSQSHHN